MSKGNIVEGDGWKVVEKKTKEKAQLWTIFAIVWWLASLEAIIILGANYVNMLSITAYGKTVLIALSYSILLIQIVLFVISICYWKYERPIRKKVYQ